MKVFCLFEAFLPLGNNIDWVPECRPDIVIVDARRHNVDEDFVIPDLRRRQHFTFPRVARLTEPGLSHDKSMHLRWNDAERRTLSKIVEFNHFDSALCGVEQAVFDIVAVAVTCAPSLREAEECIDKFSFHVASPDLRAECFVILFLARRPF
jgi:hypothetical protein